MNQHTGQTKSVWMATAPMGATGALTENIETDVCVIGAGIAGLTTAYHLLLEGKRVVVIDRGDLVSGETERTTAHLANVIDDRFVELERMHGERGAQLAAESHGAAIDRIETIIAREKIDCGFRRVDGYLFLGAENEPKLLTDELEAARRAGFADVELLSAPPITTLGRGPCLRFPRQAQFHPLEYLSGIVTAILRGGGRIYTHTPAAEIRDGSPVTVITRDRHGIRAGSVVVATNTPFNDRVTIHTKQAPYRTYVIGARIREGAVPTALYWDTEDPYHYVRLQSGRRPIAPGYDLLIVGGEDHKTGQEDNPPERWSQLEMWTRERFPIEAVEFRWSGQVLEPVDGVAFIGRNPGDRNVYIATGDSGQGMTHGTIAGMLITDLILGRDNPWETLYDPSRKSLRAIGEFTKENLNVAAQYRDYVTPGDVSDESEVRPGTGRVVRKGGRKVAVYCDERGQRHEMSAICPHLGCIVGWNAAEKSWDCPCHGSRFNAIGEVVNGPASTNLCPHEQGAEVKR